MSHLHKFSPILGSWFVRLSRTSTHDLHEINHCWTFEFSFFYVYPHMKKSSNLSSYINSINTHIRHYVILNVSFPASPFTFMHTNKQSLWNINLLQVVNFGNNKVNLRISINNLNSYSIQKSGSYMTVLTSGNSMDENSLNNPNKVIQTLPDLEIYF